MLKAADYRTDAEQGHAGAQYNLARCYQNGWGVRKDQAEAMRWYRFSADQGTGAGAQYGIGRMFECGKDFAADIAKAEQWSRGEGGVDAVYGRRTVILAKWLSRFKKVSGAAW